MENSDMKGTYELYTQFSCDLILKEDIPEELIQAIFFIAKLDSEYTNKNELANDFPEKALIEFLKCDNIHILNTYEVHSGYENFSTPKFSFKKDISERWHLINVSNFHALEDSVTLFLKWVISYVNDEDDILLGDKLLGRVGGESPRQIYRLINGVLISHPVGVKIKVNGVGVL